MRRVLLVILSVSLAAEEQPPVPVPADPPVPTPVEVPVPSPWSQEGRIGLFGANTTTTRADQSRDPTIGGAGRSTSVLASLDYKGLWKSGSQEVENIAKGRYGRLRTQGQDWTENQDEARYDGIYRYTFSAPHFVFLGWGAESVFTGPYLDDPVRPPEDARNGLDPLKAYVAGGYGQKYANWIPEDAFEWHLGARAQKRWGSRLREEERGIETGIDAFARYQGTPASFNKDLKYFVQYEGFSEFNDLAHVTNLLTAGLTFQLSKYLNLDLALRAHYETRPKEYTDSAAFPGYEILTVKQDTLLGLVYSF